MIPLNAYLEIPSFMGDKCTYLNIDGSDRNAMEDIFRLRSDISKEMKEFKSKKEPKLLYIKDIKMP